MEGPFEGLRSNERVSEFEGHKQFLPSWDL